MLANPAIFVLDEATSSVDTETEQKIHDGHRRPCSRAARASSSRTACPPMRQRRRDPRDPARAESPSAGNAPRAASRSKRLLLPTSTPTSSARSARPPCWAAPRARRRKPSRKKQTEHGEIHALFACQKGNMPFRVRLHPALQLLLGVIGGLLQQAPPDILACLIAAIHNRLLLVDYPISPDFFRAVEKPPLAAFRRALPGSIP